MLWFRLGWRNLWRNKRRTAIELSAIVGSVFLAITFRNMATGIYDQMIHDGVQMGSGHIGLYHEEYLELRQTPLVFDADAVVAPLRNLKQVETVYARAYVPGLLRSSRGARAGVATGIDFDHEAAANPMLKPEFLHAGRFPTGHHSGRTVEAVLGYGLADELGVDVDKKVVWMAQDAEGQMQGMLMRVRGLVKTGVREIDHGTVLVPRRALGRYFPVTGAAHEVAVMLRDQALQDETMPQVKAIAATLPQIEAYRWQEAMPGLYNGIRLDSAGQHIFVALMFVLVGIGTINTLLMSVMERVREFGVMRALGLTSRGIRAMVVAEAVVLGIVGSVLGTLAGCASTLYLKLEGLNLTELYGNQEFAGVVIDPIIRAAWDVPIMAVLVCGMLVVTVLASLYPAQRAIRIQPADAMRKY